jgi:hypothetical protein
MCLCHVTDKKALEEVQTKMNQMRLHRQILSTSLQEKFPLWTQLDIFAYKAPQKLVSDLVKIQQYEMARKVILLFGDNSKQLDMMVENMETQYILYLINEKRSK